ncbi:MAG: protein translocase subunit SecF [Candidatus Paceibacterota bacterium]
MKFNFTKYSTIYFIIAIVLILASIISILVFGLKLGMDFEGGSLVSIEYTDTRPTVDQVKNAINNIEGFKGAEIQLIGDKGIVIKVSKDISSANYTSVLTALETGFKINEQASGVQTISPLVGSELKNKTIIVVIAALIVMLLYIAVAFLNVSRPISSFGYGISSTLMLFHDIILPLGILAALGALYGVQLTIPVITALLTIVGYCINNTVVVFDRIRENLLKTKNMSYEEVVNKSLNETFTRCINTSLAVLLAIAPLYYFFRGEESLKYFTLTIGIGVVVGIFSSVFLASPLLVQWLKFRQFKA